jgi:hypothetical protein
MKTINKIWINELIAVGSYSLLKEMRNGYTRSMTIEELNQEDREICEAIDHFFKSKYDIEKLVIEKAEISHSEDIHFEFDIYEVDAKCDITLFKERKGEYTPERNDCDVKILELNISVL